MVKFPEAEARKFHKVFICRKCKSKIKAPNLKVIARRVSCRKCGSKVLRIKRKK